MSIIALKYKDTVVGYRVISESGEYIDKPVGDKKYLTPYSIRVEFCGDNYFRTEEEIIKLLRPDKSKDRYIIDESAIKSGVQRKLDSKLRGSKIISSFTDYDYGIVSLNIFSTQSYSLIRSVFGSIIGGEYIFYVTSLLCDNYFKIYVVKCD